MKSADSPESRVLRAFQKYERYGNPGIARAIRFFGLETLAVEAQGAVIRDIYGREFLDFATGYGVFILGHRHPRVVEAALRELQKMPMSVRMMVDEPQVELAELLAQVTPGGLQQSFFTNSGAESTEGALKLARAASGRAGVVAAWGAYHGKTFGALSVSGREMYRTPFQPLLSNVTHVPYGDIDAMAEAITGDVGAVILEPIQGENGVVVPPPGYLRGVRELCDRRGALLILDEVQTGLGRTGRMWACEWEDVAPDVMTMAKGLGGGVTPLGAVIATPEVYAVFTGDPYLHSTTYGNRLGWAAAIATIRTIQAEGLLDRSVAIGQRLMAGLREVQRANPAMIRDVRGRGCLVGVEFGNSDIGLLVISGLFSRQVLGIHTENKQEVVRFAPPLIASDAEVDRAVEAMGEAIREAESLVAMSEEEGGVLERESD